MSHSLKVVLKIILQRIWRKLLPKISEAQYGLMKDRGTRNAIFIIRMLSERSIKHQQDVYLVFIDYKKKRHWRIKRPQYQPKKTKCMVISKSETPPTCNLKLGNIKINQVDDFNYLGSVVTPNGRCKKKIRRRISLAKEAFKKMKPILCDRKLSMRIKNLSLIHI